MFLESQIILMISKISCDTENWSNDEENSVLHHRNNITFYNILQLVLSIDTKIFK